MTVKDRWQKPIYTLRDFKRDQEHAEYLRERRARIRLLRAKIKYWTAKHAQFGGQIHLITLGRFKTELKEILAQK